MAAEINAKFVGLEKSVQDAAKAAGRNLKINVGANARSVEALSQPLGRITGKADEFTKSMEAANARVLAFGASVGVLRSVTNSFKELVVVTIQVEKQMAAINAILGASTGELSKFKKEIFDVARNTEQSFETVSTAALELSRQGLAAEEVVKRLNDSLILSRLSGQSAADAVAGLTSAINGFKTAGITSAQVVNKFSEAAKSAAVSERDLAEAFKRAGAVAGQAGVSFDELVGIVSAVQEKTSRGGSVIGNSFKTIFTRIQSLDKLTTMEDLGVTVTDSAGQILSATKIIQNLAGVLQSFPDARRLQIAENLVGKFQVAPFISLLEDYNDETSKAIKITEISANATTAAYERNAALNLTLSAAISEARVNVEQLFDTLGKIGITEGLQNILGFFNTLVSDLRGLLDEETGSDIAKGLVKGIGNVISGPGLAVFAAIIGKLTKDLVSFGLGSMRTFFGLNKAAKEQAAVQGQIASTLLGNSDIQKRILAIENSQLSTEGKKLAQTKFFTTALNEQLAVMQRMQNIASRVAPGVIAGTRKGRGAGGYIPNFAGGSAFGSEQADINRGVGGAPRSARPVSIPNFNFGGGQRGTMVANTSEFIVPNFGGGSAIFNQNMAASMGLPAGARPVGAAGGYIPNFAAFKSTSGQTKGLTLDQAIDSGRFNRGALTAGFGKEAVDKKLGVVSQAGKPVAKKKSNAGVLTYDADHLGILSLFKEKKDNSTSLTLSSKKVSQTNEGVKALRAMGVNQVVLRNVQLQSVDNMKKGFSETRNRQKLAQYFTKPLVQYGSMLLGGAFKNDELKAARSELAKLARGKSSAALFSTSGEGAILESAVNLVTKGAKAIKEFKTTASERAPFDFEETGPAGDEFKTAFRFDKDLQKADAKRTASDSAVRSLITKALSDGTERGKMILAAEAAGFKKASSGYIPNYASSPLDKAINREVAAGLPINQVRINQKGTLRNSANPMGLAVTNTRDEPTGAIPAAEGFIPNYIVKFPGKRKATSTQGVDNLDRKAGKASESIDGLGKSSDETTTGQRDMLGTIFGVQMGLSLLTGATSDAEDGIFKFANSLSGAASTITTSLLAGQALGQLGGGMVASKQKGFVGGLTRKSGSLLVGLGKLGIAVGVVAGGFKVFNDIFRETSGLNDANSKALDKFTDQIEKSTFGLSQFTKVQQSRINEQIESVISGQDRDPNKKINRGGVLGFNEALTDETLRQALISGVLKGFDVDSVVKAMRDQRDRGLFLPSGEKRPFEEFKRINEEDPDFFDDALTNTEEIERALSAVANLPDLAGKAMKLVEKAKFGALSETGLKGAIRNAEAEAMEETLFVKQIKDLGIESQEVFDEIIQAYRDRRDAAFEANKKLADADLKLINKTEALARVFEISKGVREGQAARQRGLNARSALISAGLATSDQRFGVSRDRTILNQEIADTTRIRTLAQKIISESKDLKLKDAPEGIKRILNLNPNELSIQDLRDFSTSLATIAERTEGKFKEDILKYNIDTFESNLKFANEIAKIESDRNAATMTLAKASKKAAIDAIDKLNTFDLQFQRATATGFERRRLTREIDFLGEMGKLRDKPEDERLIGQAALMRAKELGDVLDDASENFVDSITNGLVDAIVQGKSLGETLRLAATDFFTMMSKAYMKQAVDSIVDGGGGGGGGNILSTVLGFIGLKNSGGMIRGGSGTRDDVPTLLTGGEFVMRKSSVNKYGTGFMSALNQGAVPKFANGGMFVPGSYGQGAITGKSNLLGFATQTGTSTSADRMVSGANFAAIALAPESIAMTSLGRSMSPAFKKTQEAKSQAFNLFVQQLQADEQRKEQLRQQAEAKKQQRKGLLASLGMAALSGFVFGGGLGNLFGGRKTTADPVLQNFGFDSDFAPLPSSAPKGIPVATAVTPKALPLMVQSFKGQGMGGQTILQGAGDIMFQGVNSKPIPKFNRNPFAALTGGPAPFKNPFAPLNSLIDQTVPNPFAGAQIKSPLGHGQFVEPQLPVGLGSLSNALFPTARPMGGMIPYMAGGGGVGYAAGVDTVPAMLSGGEFVMNAAATSRIGASNLQALNSGASMGGGSTSITKGDTNINIVVNSNGSVNQNASADAGAADKGLAVRLKDAVKGVIADETRLGGMLSA